MKWFNIICLIGVLAFSGCNSNTDNNSKVSSIDTSQTDDITNITHENDYDNETTKEDTLNVDFDFFTLTFPGLYAYTDTTVKDKDSSVIYLDLGDVFNSQAIIFSTKNNSRIDSFFIYESYKTTLSITHEGPHLDLYEWKGFQSEWMLLTETEERIFTTRLISEKESTQFPEFTREELTEVANKYSEGWGDLIKNPIFGDWTDAYWIGVGLRLLRIDIFIAREKHTKYLKAYVAMGC